MNILVTGASGFIGKRLVNLLLDKELNVKGAVRTLTKVSLAFFEEVKVGDINSKTNWLVALENVDVVIHLAARVHVMRETTTNPLAEFRRINTEATLNLAKQAAESGVKRFIYLSSIKVNGEVTLPDIPFSPDDTFIPDDPYALSKHEAEQGLLTIAETTVMEVVIIRPPLVYGPGVKANFLSMMKILNKRIPLPFGSIHNKRSLVALDNLVDLIITCIDHPAAANEVFLVSDDEDISTTELLNRISLFLYVRPHLVRLNKNLLMFILRMLGKKSLSQRLCSSLQVDISKTKKVLSWTPPISVDEGLQKTAQYFLKSKVL